MRIKGDPRLIVGLDHPDDAAVWRLDDTTALIQTVDVITPIVDDPYTFGQIAANNALSDIAVMGGEPLTALAFLGFPACSLPADAVAAILQGGVDRVESEGGRVVGGHTVEDPEIKYGLAVTGVVRPDRLIASTGARPGDLLCLTKRLGTGIVATAVKAGEASPASEAEMIETMLASNFPAARLARDHGCTAMTDVTGFGFVGHAVTMASASQVTFLVDPALVPVMTGIAGLCALGMIPAGAYRNRDHFVPSVSGIGPAGADPLIPLFDPQTAGGVLAAIPPGQAGRFCEACREAGVEAVIIGTVAGKRERWLHLETFQP